MSEPLEKCLVLTRRRGESIVLDGPGTIEVQAWSRGKAVLVIRAPSTTRVLRAELKPFDRQRKSETEQC